MQSLISDLLNKHPGVHDLAKVALENAEMAAEKERDTRTVDSAAAVEEVLSDVWAAHMDPETRCRTFRLRH